MAGAEARPADGWYIHGSQATMLAAKVREVEGAFRELVSVRVPTDRYRGPRVVGDGC